MRRLAWFGSLALVAALAAVATIALTRSSAADAPGVAAQPAGDPVAFVKGVVGAVVDDDYRRAWPTLHPAHQRVAPLEDYVKCEWRAPIPGRLRSIAVLGVADKRVALPGLGAPVASTAVRLRVTIQDMATGEQTSVTSTFHAVSVAGRWRWVLPGERYALYRAGACARSGAPAETV